MLIAAVLHDTVEDTDTTFADIKTEFGDLVTKYVEELTDVSKPEDGNRKVRKTIDRWHLAGASSAAQTVKLADLLHNTHSIVRYGKGFAKIYMSEKLQLLNVLKHGDASLLAQANAKVVEYYG
jgi:(p)ppGpp synthase/HD superfamily hydrolase